MDGFNLTPQEQQTLKKIENCTERIKEATEKYGKEPQKEAREKFRREMNSLGQEIFKAMDELDKLN